MMPDLLSSRPSPFALVVRKVLVSAFVVISFVAYAIHDRLTSPAPVNTDRPNSLDGAQTPSQVASHQVVPVEQPVPTSEHLAPTLESPSTAPQQVVPTAVPLDPTATPQGKYLDGTYTGPTVNVFYGLVQVQATIQGGAITDVQFLQYPSDRRTSQQINAIAMPYLKQEAIQAQSAYINIISGATLTSEGFAQSLYYLLNQATAQS